MDHEKKSINSIYGSGRGFIGSVKSIGLLCNYNTARDRLEGGAPRKAQLRIKNVEDYMRRIGYISPAKFNNMKAVYMSKYGSAHESSGSAFMSGLKYLTR